MWHRHFLLSLRLTTLLSHNDKVLAWTPARYYGLLQTATRYFNLVWKAAKCSALARMTTRPYGRVGSLQPCGLSAVYGWPCYHTGKCARPLVVSNWATQRHSKVL